MRQEGKTNLLKWLLSQCSKEMRYTAFDTMGVLSRHFEPNNPESQKIIKPRWGYVLPEFEKACEQVWREGNQIFAIEEVQIFCSKHLFKIEKLRDLINLGGNRNIGLWFTIRRVAEVHNDIIGNCQHHYIFKTYLPQDVEWLSQFVPREIVEQSKNLPPYHFIYYHVGREAQVFKPVKFMG
jgi:hypothetical protein